MIELMWSIFLEMKYGIAKMKAILYVRKIRMIMEIEVNFSGRDEETAKLSAEMRKTFIMCFNTNITLMIIIKRRIHGVKLLLLQSHSYLQ